MNFNTSCVQYYSMGEIAVQPLLRKLDAIKRKINSSLELQLEILEKFIDEVEPTEDEISAIESKEALIDESELRGEN